VAEVFLADPASQVSASSALGVNGVVNIQAPVTNLSGAVAPLPQEFAPTAELLRDRCAGRLREGRMSRLVLGGRDGVPREPGSLLLSPLIQMGSRGKRGAGGHTSQARPSAGARVACAGRSAGRAGCRVCQVDRAKGFHCWEEYVSTMIYASSCTCQRI
jgi:hypothetical protein